MPSQGKEDQRLPPWHHRAHGSFREIATADSEGWQSMRSSLEVQRASVTTTLLLGTTPRKTVTLTLPTPKSEGI